MIPTPRRPRRAPRRATLAGPLLGAFLLAGCGAAGEVALERGAAAVRQAKDAEAEALKAAVCAMSLGAYYRVNDATERRALAALCGGAWERPLTAADLELLRRLRDLGEGPAR